MPTVHTTSDITPPILVTLHDDAIDPDATVAPEGQVQFTVMNSGTRPHVFTLAQAVAETGGIDTVTHRSEEVAPGDSTDLVVDLEAGRYTLGLLGGAGAHLADRRAQLTVQPAATYSAEEGRAGGRTE